MYTRAHVRANTHTRHICSLTEKEIFFLSPKSYEFFFVCGYFEFCKIFLGGGCGRCLEVFGLII